MHMSKGYETHCDDHLARRLDTAGHDRVSFFIEVHRDDLSTSDIAATDFAIQDNARVVKVTRHELRDLLDVRRLDNSLEQVVSQDLFNESRINGSLFNAEDATLGNDVGESIVAGSKERDLLLRGEEFGGVLDLTE